MESKHPPEETRRALQAILAGEEGFEVMLVENEELFEYQDSLILVNAYSKDVKHSLERWGYCYSPWINQDTGVLQVVGLPYQPYVVQPFMIWCLKDIHPHILGANLRALIIANKASLWLTELQNKNFLQFILPELASATTVPGGKYHNETVFEHLIATLQVAESRTKSECLKWAALFHDIGKVGVWKQEAEDKHTFYCHEVEGARVTQQIMQRLGIPNEIVGHTIHLVRKHMFMFPEDVSDRTLRRWLLGCGKRAWKQLIELRTYDRLGNYATRHKPAYTAHLKRLEERCNRIIANSQVVFKEDINCVGIEFKELTEEQNDGIFLQLCDIINKDPEKNNDAYLREYLKRVYQDGNNTSDTPMPEMQPQNPEECKDVPTGNL